MKYLYFFSYNFKAGLADKSAFGEAFVTLNGPIESAEDVGRARQIILRAINGPGLNPWSSVKDIAIISFQLIKFSEEDIIVNSDLPLQIKR